MSHSEPEAERIKYPSTEIPEDAKRDVELLNNHIRRGSHLLNSKFSQQLTSADTWDTIVSVAVKPC